MSDPQTERIYCAQQINIPPTFPRILKHYAKAAIRTQPHDLLRWTAAYFRALANGEVPPAKERLEYPPFAHPSGITPGYLRTLLNRYGHVDKVSLRALLQDWQGLDLPETRLYQLFVVAGLSDKEYCDFYRFLAVACGFLGNNLLETMIYVCELLTREPEGGSAMVPLRIFLDLYGYLADLDCSGNLLRHCKVGPDALRNVVSTSHLAIDLLSIKNTCQKEANSTDEDVCGETSGEKQPSGSFLGILKDYGDDPARISDVDAASAGQSVAGDKTEIEIKPIDRHVSRGGKSESAIGTDVENLAGPSIIDHAERLADDHEGLSKGDVDTRETPDDSSEFNFEDVEQAIDYDETTTASIDLESSLEKTCRCEPESDPIPPDPLKEFWNRMREEVEAGRLDVIFRVPGIGPPVSVDRVTAIGLWLADCARRQEGLVGPRNIRHFLCPNLDDALECDCTQAA
ncbi:Ropporin-1-like protein [Ooceraea biroi]|uniref:Ropporin-1-like protein n=1 Tax=Ooceraea biroi TaxID=2015173 RepID=A0A026WMT1_OOCBI|nr:Ropporin-1-like protein [Ooceraea biroi]